MPVNTHSPLILRKNTSHMRLQHLFRSSLKFSTLIVAAGLLPNSTLSLARDPTAEELLRIQAQKIHPVVPEDFLVSAFAQQYYCKKLSYRPPPSPGYPGSGHSSPVPIPTAAPTAAPVTNAKLLCDGDHRLIAHSPDKTLGLDTYRFKSECHVAIEQFRTTKGCYCGDDYNIKCLTPEFKVQKIGNSFRFASECAEGLKGLDSSFEVRSR